MKAIDIVVIGSGLYVCGKGTSGYGTILPAVFEFKREYTNLGNVYCVSTSSNSAKEVASKVRDLEKKTGLSIQFNSFPKTGSQDSLAYRKVINDIKKPACAIIAVPDHLHFQVGKDCLDAGLHCLIVKPFTPTVSEGSKLVNLSNKKGLYGAVEFHKRWDRSNLLLKDKIQSGELGDPLNCWVEYSQRKSMPLSFFQKWASKTSVLQYLGVHYIDIISFVTGALPLRVMAIGQKTELIKHDLDTYDSIQSIIEWKMQNGTKFTQTLLTSWVDPESSSAASDQKIKFIGTEGRFEADQKERGIRINTKQEGLQHINPDFSMPYGINDGNVHWNGYGIESIKTFLKDVLFIENNKISLKEIKNRRPSFEDSLISTAVVEAAHKSLENGSIWQNVESLS
tara:strand:- start:832 stop:2019 length:1188 start_codon:yes stop_codon:yes gene_type:complete